MLLSLFVRRNFSDAWPEIGWEAPGIVEPATMPSALAVIYTHFQTGLNA